MSDDHFIRDPGHAAEALQSDALVPPPPPASLSTGSVARLRNAMARFSSGDEHGSRRSAVERAIARIDLQTLRNCASAQTQAHLGRGMDAAQLRSVVPTESLALQLGIDESELGRTVGDTELVVRAIGRGEAVDDVHNAACDRLLDRVASHPDGSVAALSLLYQGFDATAALLQAVADAEESGTSRRPALEATVRVASSAVKIGEVVLAPGEVLRVSLQTESLEFGEGTHRCPGSEVAWAIVAGMADAATDACG